MRGFYHLELDSKITFIRGDSGIGKTHLVSELESYFRSYTEGNMHTVLSVSDDYKLVVLPEFIDNEPYGQDHSDKVDFHAFLLKRVGSHDVSKVIFITDERSDYVNSRDFQKAVNVLPSLFIFIDRDPLYSIPYSWGSVKTFRYLNGINILSMYIEQDCIVKPNQSIIKTGLFK